MQYAPTVRSLPGNRQMMVVPVLYKIAHTNVQIHNCNKRLKVRTLQLFITAMGQIAITLKMHYGSEKLGQIAKRNQDRHQNLADCSSGHTTPLQKITSKGVHDFLRYFAHRHIDRQTDCYKNITFTWPCIPSSKVRMLMAGELMTPSPTDV